MADASLLVKTLTSEPGTAAARTVLVGDEYVIAPDLIRIEVASALSKKVRYFGLPRHHADAAMSALPAFLEEMVSSDDLLSAAFAYSLQLAHALRDCVYLALAKARACRLATCDQKFVARANEAGLGELVMLVSAA